MLLVRDSPALLGESPTEIPDSETPSASKHLDNVGYGENVSLVTIGRYDARTRMPNYSQRFIGCESKTTIRGLIILRWISD